MTAELKRATQEHFDKIKERMGDRFEALSAEAVEELKWAAQTYAKLRFDSIRGEDVGDAFIDLESVIADWSYVAASAAKSAFWETALATVKDALPVVAKLAAGALARSLQG